MLATLSGWGRPTLAPRGDLPAFWKAAVAVLEKNSNGNVAFALIREGDVYDEHFQSKGRPVDRRNRGVPSDILGQQGLIAQHFDHSALV